MLTRQLFLTSTATSSPYPTTSRLLSESANAVEVQLGPGEFDSTLPGASDAGQWNPSSPLGDTTAAAEIDSTLAVPDVARQGWLYNADLTGLVLARGAWTIQLRLRANQGTGTTGFICARVSIVTGLAGAWTTVKQIFVTTRVTGAGSTTAGQAGWRDQNEAAITVTSTAANFSVTIGADDATTQGHTFASGERILVELGFCNGNSTADRTWRLDFNTSNAFITTPDIALPARTGTAAESHAVQTESGAGASVVGATSASASASQTEASGGAVTVGATSASSSSAQTEATAASTTVGATAASTGSAQTEAIAGNVAAGNPERTGTIAEAHAVQTEAAAGGASISGASASSSAAQTDSAAAGALVGAASVESHTAQANAAVGAVVASATAFGASAAQTDSASGGVLASASSAETHSAHTSAASASVTITGAIVESSSAQTDAIAGGTPLQDIEGALAEAHAAHTEVAAGGVTVTVTIGSASTPQQGACAGSVLITAQAASEQSPQVEAIAESAVEECGPPNRARGRGDRASRRRR